MTSYPDPTERAMRELAEVHALVRARAAAKEPPVMEALPAEAARKITEMRAKAIARDAKPPPAVVERARKVMMTEEPEPPPRKVHGRTPTTEGTAAALFRELILAGKLSATQIHDAVEAQFGRTIPRNAVAHYTAELRKRGLLPKVTPAKPAPKKAASVPPTPRPVPPPSAPEPPRPAAAAPPPTITAPFPALLGNVHAALAIHLNQRIAKIDLQTMLVAVTIAEMLRDAEK